MALAWPGVEDRWGRQNIGVENGADRGSGGGGEKERRRGRRRRGNCRDQTGTWQPVPSDLLGRLCVSPRQAMP